MKFTIRQLLGADRAAKSYRPSQAVPAMGQTPMAESHSSCVGYTNVFSQVIESAPPPVYGAIGELWQMVVQHRMNIPPECAEVPLEGEIHGMRVRGRADFIVGDEVIECKAVLSDARRRSLLGAVKGSPSPSWETQLLTYLKLSGKRLGRIWAAFASWEDSSASKLQFHLEREWFYEVDDAGVVMRDGEVIGRLDDMLSYYRISRPDEMNRWERPIGSKLQATACIRCPAAKLCGMAFAGDLDTEMESDDFKDVGINKPGMITTWSTRKQSNFEKVKR